LRRRCNPVLPPALSRRIANELSKEFAHQAELEHAAALPITVMLAPDEVGKAKIELGFIGEYGGPGLVVGMHVAMQSLTPKRVLCAHRLRRIPLV
jgi:hypothetical protein